MESCVVMLGSGKPPPPVPTSLAHSVLFFWVPHTPAMFECLSHTLLLQPPPPCSSWPFLAVNSETQTPGFLLLTFQFPAASSLAEVLSKYFTHPSHHLHLLIQPSPLESPLPNLHKDGTSLAPVLTQFCSFSVPVLAKFPISEVFCMLSGCFCWGRIIWHHPQPWMKHTLRHNSKTIMLLKGLE